ncbi:MAG: WD40 repeat domain-containing protein [Candidatus Eisenbacteria bacterium]
MLKRARTDQGSSVGPAAALVALVFLCASLSVGELRAGWREPSPDANPAAHASVSAEARSRYREAIRSAAQALQAGDRAAAKLALEQAPPAARAWEWRYLSLAVDRAETTLVGHTERVNALAISPNARWIVSASADSTIRLWEFDTGVALLTIRGQAGEVRGVDVSTVGPAFASVGSDRMLRFYSLPSGQLVWSVALDDGDPEEVRFAPGAAALAVRFADGRVALYNAIDGKRGESRAALTLSESQGPERDAGTNRLSFVGSPVILAGSADSSVVVQDLANQQPLIALGGRSEAASRWPARLHAVAADFAGRWIAAAGGDGAVHLWDNELYEERRLLADRAVAVGPLAMEPRGRRLAATCVDSSLALWDLDAGAPLGRLAGDAAPVTAAVFHPSGEYLITGDAAGALKVWDATHPEPAAITLQARVDGVDWAPDGNHLALAAADSTVHVLALVPQVEALVVRGQAAGAARVRYSRDGGRLFCLDGAGGVAAWDAVTGGVVRRFVQSGVREIALSPDGRVLAGAGADGRIQTWDSVSGRLERTVAERRAPAAALAFTTDGSRLAIAWADGRIELREVASARSRGELRLDGAAPTSIVDLGDGRIAIGSADGALRSWQPTGGAIQEMLSAHGVAVTSLALSPDRSRLVVSRGRIELLDAIDGAPLLRLDAGTAGGAVAFDRTGEQIALVNGDGKVRILEASPGPHDSRPREE